MSRWKKMLISVALTSLGIIAAYSILNPLIVLNRSSKTLGEYDFALSPADVEVLVEGTGKQHISGNSVSTNIRIKAVNWNKTSYKLDEGSVMKVNEYLVVYENRKVLETLVIPGRSIYGMGTNYKRLKKGQEKMIYLKLDNETKQFWIVPEKLVEKK